jgi:hypothetical protein
MCKQLFFMVYQWRFFLQQPPSYVVVGQKTKVCWLLKTFYGLKQSPRMWYEQFTTHLLHTWYNKCNGNPNVYIQRTKDGTFIFLYLYVDDLVIVSPNLAYLEQSKAELANEFAMNDSGNLSYYLGTQVIQWRESKSFLVTQAKYILDILT